MKGFLIYRLLVVLLVFLVARPNAVNAESQKDCIPLGQPCYYDPVLRSETPTAKPCCGDTPEDDIDIDISCLYTQQECDYDLAQKTPDRWCCDQEDNFDSDIDCLKTLEAYLDPNLTDRACFKASYE